MPAAAPRAGSGPGHPTLRRSRSPPSGRSSGWAQSRRAPAHRRLRAARASRAKEVRLRTGLWAIPSGCRWTPAGPRHRPVPARGEALAPTGPRMRAHRTQTLCGKNSQRQLL